MENDKKKMRKPEECGLWELFQKGRREWNRWVERSISHGQEAVVDFSNVEFEDPVDFEGFSFPHNTVFKGAIFSKQANFHGASFSGVANFACTEFSDKAIFSGAEFSGSAEFVHAEFSGPTLFKNVVFSSYALFETAKKGAKFSREANFEGATFEDKAAFSHRTFNDEAIFNNCKFKTTTNFDESVFERPPRFLGTEMHQDTSFHRTEFNNKDAKNDGHKELAVHANAWRALKLAMNRTHNHQQELLFFGYEMDKKVRLYKTEWREFTEHKKLGLALGLKLYKWSSDYGRSYILPLIWLVVSIAVFSMGYYYTFQDSDLSWSLSLATAVSFMGMIKTVLDTFSLNPNFAFLFFIVLQGIVSVILIFLIGLGLRNRFSIK